MGFIIQSVNEVVKEETANYVDASSVFSKLLMSLDYLIGNSDETAEQKNKIKQDVVTDVIIPGIKEVYQQAVDYALWGRYPVPRHANRANYASLRRTTYMRNYSDDDIPDQEDEDE